MHEPELPVVFQPSGKRAHVLDGASLPEAAIAAGLTIELPCGGAGVCRKCRVQLSQGAGTPTAVEQETFTAAELAAGYRLACQTHVGAPATVVLADSDLRAARPQILSHASAVREFTGAPPVTKRYVELSPPSRQDDIPDLGRLAREIDDFEPTLGAAQAIGAALRSAGFCGTAVLDQRRLIDFEPGDTTVRLFGVACDIGTTTLVASLLDLNRGTELAVASRLNPQTRFGDDVLSRILFASGQGGDPAAGGDAARQNLGTLQRLVLEAVTELIADLCRQASVAPREIYTITFAGNTTMQQLLCGIDVRPLGLVPFTPTLSRGLTFSATELGLPIHPRASTYVLPAIGGFVGGDTVAGILATGLGDTEGPTLLVDIGTNGEIVLAVNGRLTAASAAAGPAFEGARISQGMRACPGAIEKVVVDGRLRTQVIGDVPPVGLCGSALVDAAAELLRHGVLTPQGRLLSRDQLPAGVLPELAERIVQHDGHSAVVLAAADETGGRPVLVTQRDLRELQLAVGAIRAGVRLLLEREGVQPRELDAVYLAGGFGNFIRRSNAQRVGLLPPEIDRPRIRFFGNTSLAGARLTALSAAAREEAEELAARTEHVDLSTNPSFQTAFAESMLMPEVVWIEKAK